MAEEFAKQDEYTGQEPAVNNGQHEEKQGRRKSRAVSVFVIILVVAFVGYLVLWKCGYRFTSRPLLRTDVLAGEHRERRLRHGAQRYDFKRQRDQKEQFSLS